VTVYLVGDEVVIRFLLFGVLGNYFLWQFVLPSWVAIFMYCLIIHVIQLMVWVIC